MLAWSVQKKLKWRVGGFTDQAPVAALVLRLTIPGAAAGHPGLVLDADDPVRVGMRPCIAPVCL